jgi:hypothetical protein
MKMGKGMNRNFTKGRTPQNKMLMRKCSKLLLIVKFKMAFYFVFISLEKLGH